MVHRSALHPHPRPLQCSGKRRSARSPAVLSLLLPQPPAPLPVTSISRASMTNGALSQVPRAEAVASVQYARGRDVHSVSSASRIAGAFPPLPWARGRAVITRSSCLALWRNFLGRHTSPGKEEHTRTGPARVWELKELRVYIQRPDKRKQTSMGGARVAHHLTGEVVFAPPMQALHIH